MYVIGLDIGTSSVKGVLMDENKKTIATVTRRQTYYFSNNLKLMDPDVFCENCFAVLRELKSKAKGKVIAVCASGAAGNAMIVGEKNSPIYGWQNKFDKETVDKYLGQYSSEDIRQIVGWPKQFGFPQGVFAYLLEREPETIKKADKICMSIEYLNYKLTGKWGITPSMGTPFFLINQETGKYHKDFLNIFGINEEQLPSIMKNYSVLGTLTDDAAQKTGLSKETKIVLGTFDHPAGAIGAGVYDEGDMLLSCGTSWVALFPFGNREKPIERKMLTDPFMAPYGNWCGMSSITSISQKVSDCKQYYLGETTYEEFDAMLSRSNYEYGKIKIDLDNFKELDGNYSKDDIARSIALTAANELNIMLAKCKAEAKKIKIIGGISESPQWLKIISEITGIDATVVNGETAGAVGSAAMAAVGAGIFKSVKELFAKG